MQVFAPETIVIATPHNLRLRGRIGVISAENSSGMLRESGGEVKVRAKCDVPLAGRLLEAGEKAGLPVVGANHGTASGAASDMPMDWGTLVPLWFFLNEKRLRSRVVIVTPSREIPLAQNFEFGRLIADVAEKERKKIAFVASADQAHAHKKEGPYGFNKAARKYDEFVIKAIVSNKLKSVMTLGKKFVDAAKPDSLWQMTMLAGAIARVGMEGRFFSYQVPTYYGMICAGFHRV